MLIFSDACMLETILKVCLADLLSFMGFDVRTWWCDSAAVGAFSPRSPRALDRALPQGIRSCASLGVSLQDAILSKA